MKQHSPSPLANWCAEREDKMDALNLELYHPPSVSSPAPDYPINSFQRELLSKSPYKMHKEKSEQVKVKVQEEEDKKCGNDSCDPLSSAKRSRSKDKTKLYTSNKRSKKTSKGRKGKKQSKRGSY